MKNTLKTLLLIGTLVSSGAAFADYTIEIGTNGPVSDPADYPFTIVVDKGSAECQISGQRSVCEGKGDASGFKATVTSKHSGRTCTVRGTLTNSKVGIAVKNCAFGNPIIWNANDSDVIAIF